MSDEYIYPKVNEIESVMEHVTPFGRFGLDNEEYRGWPRKLADNLNALGYAVTDNSHIADYSTSENPLSTHVEYGFDYSNQLEFHKQEVAEAPKRGMPQAQVDYHLGRIALIKKDFMPAAPAETPRPSAPSGPAPEQHQLDCTKNDSGECGCKK